MRTVFENIAMAITEKSQNPTPESEGNIKSAIKKALRMVSKSLVSDWSKSTWSFFDWSNFDRSKLIGRI